MSLQKFVKKVKINFEFWIKIKIKIKMIKSESILANSLPKIVKNCNM